MATKAKYVRRTCWVCGQIGMKYYQKHHVMGADTDEELTVWLCRRCHYLESIIKRFFGQYIDDAQAVGRLLTLLRFHLKLPDARTVVTYEYTEKKK